MNLNEDLKDNWFILPGIVLLIILLIRVYWTFMRLNGYPFHHIPDAGNHIIFLFFLVKYGFHQLVPNYWNGFILFSNYPPGWHFLTLPLYYLTGNVVSATALSLVQSLGLGFLFTFILGRLMRISILKRMVFFLLFFASPVALDYINIGRYPELTGWVLFIPFFSLIIWYKNHSIDKKFLLFIPLYSSIILTHIYVLAVSSFLIISLFLVKKFKEKVIIALSFILSFILTYFWWRKAFPFMFSHGASLIKGSSELLLVGSIMSYNTIILLSFLTIFYFYYKSNGNKKRVLLFYSPLLVLSLLILTRLITLIPILNTGWVMPYNMFFLFITLYLFFNTDFKTFPRIFRKTMPIFLIVLSISMFVFSIMRVDFSSSDSLRIRSLPDSIIISEVLSILPEIEGRYMFITTEGWEGMGGEAPKILDFHAADYAIIHYNLSMPFGPTHPGGSVPEHMKETYKKIYGCDNLWGECPKELQIDCETIINVSEEQNVKSLISSDNGCDLLKKCGFKEKVKKEQICLFIYKTIPL